MNQSELDKKIEKHQKWLLKKEGGERLSFPPWTDLSGLDFERINLKDANFRKTKLTGAVFCQANLEGTDFSQADLGKANFSFATLSHAIFDGSNLEKTDFGDALLDWAVFQDANLNRTNFRCANLHDAQFLGENYFRYTSFEIAKLQHVYWENCTFDHTCFKHSIISYEKELILKLASEIEKEEKEKKEDEETWEEEYLRYLE